MRLFATIALVALAVSLPAGEPSAADFVGRLKSLDASYDDWPPIIEAGKAAIPELKKLLADPNEEARAAAAVLLYRLGDATALNTLDALLEAKSAAARKEAAEAIAAFTGGPAGDGAGLAAWRAWWKANHDNALAAEPLASLYGKVTGVEASTGLVALSVAGRHGSRRGMQFNVRRGDDFVCLLDIVFATGKGSVGRIVPFSDRSAPKEGNGCFWTKPQGK